MITDYDPCNIQAGGIFVLILFLVPFAINELFFRVFKRKAKLTTIAFVAIILVWFFLIPYQEIAFPVSISGVLLGYYFGGGPSVYPRYVRKFYVKYLPQSKDAFVLYGLLSKKLSANGRLLPFSVPITIVSTWLYLIVYAFLWKNTFNTSSFAVLGVVSVMYGVSVGLLFLLHNNYEKRPDMSGNSVVNEFQYVFVESIFGRRNADNKEKQSSTLPLLGGAITLFGSPGWLQIILALIIAAVFADFRPAELYGVFDDLISKIDLIGASFTQNVNALSTSAAEYCFNLVVGVAIARKQRWGRLAYLLFTPFVLFLSLRNADYDSVPFLWLSFGVYIFSIIYLNLPKIRVLFEQTKTDTRKSFGSLLIYLSCVSLSWGLIRVSSFPTLIGKPFPSQYLFALIISAIGLILGILSARLWGWEHRNGIFGLLFSVIGFLFFLNSNYVTMIFCSISEFDSVRLFMLGQFIFFPILLLLGIGLLAQQRRRAIRDHEAIVLTLEHDSELSEELQYALVQLSALIKRISKAIVTVLILVGLGLFAFYLFNQIRLSPAITARKYWTDIQKLGDNLNVKNNSVEQRIEAIEEIANSTILGPVSQTSAYLFEQIPIQTIGKSFDDPSFEVRVAAIKAIGKLIRERPDLYGLADFKMLLFFTRHDSKFEQGYVKKYLDLSKDKAPEVRISLATELADADIFVESMIGITYYSSRQTLVQMAKKEEDEFVRAIVLDSLSIRIERDYQQGLLTLNKANDLLVKYNLPLLMEK